MLKTLTATLFLVAALATAVLALPVADSAGDYARDQPCKTWLVTDRDPHGLNLRVSPPGTQVYRDKYVDPNKWAVARSVPEGAILHCLEIYRDVQGKTWLNVRYNGSPPTYFVRANSKYVSPLAGEPVQPDGKGNFTSRGHVYWKVVDKTPLNGRFRAGFPADTSAEMAPTDIRDWPVVTSFKPGTVLRGRQGNGGIFFLKNVDQNPWLMVELPGNKWCFVRAQRDFIQPADGP